MIAMSHSIGLPDGHATSSSPAATTKKAARPMPQVSSLRVIGRTRRSRASSIRPVSSPCAGWMTAASDTSGQVSAGSDRI